MNLTFFCFFLGYCPRVMKGRARDKRSRHCSQSDFHRRDLRRPPVAATSRRRSVAKKCRDVAIHDAPFRDGPSDCRSRRFIYDSCIIPMRRAITFISIMTGEQLNLHGKSHRPRNEARPQIRNSRSIGVHTGTYYISHITYYRIYI